jgi:hypothetical protein
MIGEIYSWKKAKKNIVKLKKQLRYDETRLSMQLTYCPYKGACIFYRYPLSVLNNIHVVIFFAFVDKLQLSVYPIYFIAYNNVDFIVKYLELWKMWTSTVA